MDYTFEGTYIENGTNMENFINSGEAANTYDEWKGYRVAQQDLAEQDARLWENSRQQSSQTPNARPGSTPNWLQQENEKRRQEIARQQEMQRDIDRNPTFESTVYTEKDYKYAYELDKEIKIKFIHNNKNCRYLGNSNYKSTRIIGRRNLNDYSGREGWIKALNSHLRDDSYHVFCPICYPEVHYSNTLARKVMEEGYQHHFKQGFYAEVAGGGIFMHSGGYIHKQGCIHIKGRGAELLGFHESIDSAKNFVEKKFFGTRANQMFPCCACFSKELGLDGIKNLRTVHFRCVRNSKTDVTIHSPNCTCLQPNDPDLLISPYANTAKTAFKMLRDGGFNLIFCKKCLPPDIEQQVNLGKIGTQR